MSSKGRGPTFASDEPMRRMFRPEELLAKSREVGLWKMIAITPS